MLRQHTCADLSGRVYRSHQGLMTLMDTRVLKSHARCAGARIASIVVSRPELFQEWNKEMEYMSGRIKVRQPLQPLSNPFPSA